MAYILRADLACLGFNLTGINDSVLDDICLQASHLVDSYCNRSLNNGSLAFEAGSNTERLAAFVNYTGFKLFPSLCVNSVTSMKVYKTITSYDTIDSSYIQINTMLNTVETFYRLAYKPLYVELIYTYGYDTIPTKLKYASMHIAKDILNTYMSANKVGFADVSMLKEGEYQANRNILNVIPKEAQVLLNSFKRYI